MRPGLGPNSEFPSGLFADAPADTTVEDSQQRFKQAMIDDAIKTAAVQMAASAAVWALSLEAVAVIVPPIGTIIAAVLAIIGYFGSRYAKREVKSLIANAVQTIKNNTAAAQREIQDQSRVAANEEYAAAQTLAASGQALGELGATVFDRAGKAVTVAARQVAAPVAKPIARAITVPVKLIGRGVLQTAILGAHLVGDKKGEERARHAEATWNEKARYFDRASIQLLGDPVALIRDLHGVPAQYLMGTSGINVAAKKCRDLINSAQTVIDKMKAENLAGISTPEYRLTLRISLAKMIRQDPSELAKARWVTSIEQQAAGTLAAAEQAAVAGAPTASGGGAAAPLGILAVIGYFLLHK